MVDEVLGWRIRRSDRRRLNLVLEDSNGCHRRELGSRKRQRAAGPQHWGFLQYSRDTEDFAHLLNWNGAGVVLHADCEFVRQNVDAAIGSVQSDINSINTQPAQRISHPQLSPT